MMFREKVIPPHAGIKTRINPKMPPLEELNIKIARRVEPFLSLTEPRRVLISSFGASVREGHLGILRLRRLTAIGW
jgi:hypothetical protein